MTYQWSDNISRQLITFFFFSRRRKEAPPGPYRLGSSSYSIDFCPRPLRRRTPPRVREGNILNSYPGNVLYPYKLPEEVGNNKTLIYKTITDVT